MLNQKPLDKLIFLDIETVPQHRSFFDMSETMQKLFLKKFKKDAEQMLGVNMDDWNLSELKAGKIVPLEEVEKFYNNRGALHAEFAQIVCISIGFCKKWEGEITSETEFQFQTKSFFGTDETKLLKEFYDTCKNVLSKSHNHDYHLSSFNGKVFDYPMIAKRMLLNWLPLPPFFDVSEVKPWDMGHLQDLKEVYKWGVFDGNSSLALLCEVFGISSSKIDIEGSQVRNVYYEDGDVERIAKYCSLDVLKTFELHLRLKGMRNNVIHI